jgi:aryl-alcohol dehydrogenase-like predicted oxidoreductase
VTDPLPAKQITLGTMRLHEKFASAADCADFLGECSDAGIGALHSSKEYESFPFLQDALARLRVSRPDIAFRHAVKLGEPSFDDDDFSPARLTAKIDTYRRDLGVDTLDSVQWMWRRDLNDAAQRLEAFASAGDMLGNALDAEKARAAVGEFGCFPYDPKFAQRAIESGHFDSLYVYYNVVEQEYDETISSAHNHRMKVHAIRPLAAGRSIVETGLGARALICEILAEGRFATVVVSLSSRAQLEALEPIDRSDND